MYPFLSVVMKENIYLVADNANHGFQVFSIKFSTKQQKQWLLNWDYMPLEISIYKLKRCPFGHVPRRKRNAHNGGSGWGITISE